MNQQNPIILLRDFVDDDSPFGNDLGQLVYGKLLKKLNTFPQAKIIGISLKGIRRTDASFPRESVISLAKTKRGEIGFYLQDFESRDLMDNWNYAAKAKDQPILMHRGREFEVIGPDLNDGTKELLAFIMKKDQVTTSMVAEEFDITAQNASGKLKKLLTQGLILGVKDVAESGGLEYNFKAIK